MLPKNCRFWGCAAEGIFTADDEYINGENEAVTVVLIPESDQFRVRPVTIDTMDREKVEPLLRPV